MIPQARRPEEIIEQQKLDAAKLKQNGSVPAVIKSALPAVADTDNRDPVDRYLDQMAPSSFAGQLIKFSKAGKFEVAETRDQPRRRLHRAVRRDAGRPYKI